MKQQGEDAGADHAEDGQGEEDVVQPKAKVHGLLRSVLCGARSATTAREVFVPTG